MGGGGGIPQRSSGYSLSESGDYYSPEQMARIGALYPRLFQLFNDSTRPTGGAQGFASLLHAVGGSPAAGLGQPFAFGPTADYGQPYDFRVGGGPAGGVAGAYPEVTAGPIWDDQRVQERVNLGRAGSEQALAGQQRDLAERMAGLGYGASSPLAQALVANAAAVNLAGTTGAENALRWQAAQGNAQHLLASQQAAVERAQALGQEDVQRRSLSSKDDIERRQMASADELQRRHLTGVERLQREKLRADEGFRQRQAYDESDIRRRELTQRQSGIDSQTQMGQLNAAIQGMMQMNRPSQRQYAYSEQSSGPYKGGTFSMGGKKPNGLWGGSSFLRA